jgi:hypothetical protein
MNWTQYLLGKLAEEASEVTKEALKCQHHGVASQYKGRNAIMELRNEFLELTAVIEMLEERKDVQRALGEHHINLVTGHDTCQDDDNYDITYWKVARLCYYALIDYEAGQVTLTKEEFDQIQGKAQSFAQRGDNRSIDHIQFYSPGIGSYRPDELIDPPMAKAMKATMLMANTLGGVRDALAPVTVNLGGSIQECAEQMKKALVLNCQLIEAEWDTANKADLVVSQNSDGTSVYSWPDLKEDVKYHIHVKVDHYDIIQTHLKTGRHVETLRAEYKTF